MAKKGRDQCLLSAALGLVLHQGLNVFVNFTPGP